MTPRSSFAQPIRPALMRQRQRENAEVNNIHTLPLSYAFTQGLVPDTEWKQ